MKSGILCKLAWLCAVALLFASRGSATPINYYISLKNPGQHIFHITMHVPVAQNDKEIVVAMPAWNALYQVRDFAYRVHDVRASESQPGLTPPILLKYDKQTWRIALAPSGARDVAIDYSINWDDTGPFNSQFNEHHAFINFAEVLMYVPDRRKEDVTVMFGDVPDGWHSVAELLHGDTPNSFIAHSYDSLVDAPVELGKFEEFGFDEGGAHFRVVVDGKGWRRDWLEDDLRRITKYQTQLMGGAPFTEYTFFFHLGSFLEVGGGGMEHANCTAISAGSVESAAATAAHEFFHAWNVKRIRPQTLEPVDFTKEQYTRALWFAEGVTSTYGAYALGRSGVWSKDQFYADLAAQISELESRPARLWQSVEESSLDAWFEKYSEYRAPDRSISYYNKGQIDGIMLDLAIRDATDNHKSLDDVLRRMYEVYAKQGKYYNDSDGIRVVVEEVTAADFGDFFRQYVAGTAEIPYDKFLDAAGLELKVDRHKIADIGFTLAHAPGTELTVSQIEPGSPAEAAGLRAGDLLLTWNDADPSILFPLWMHNRQLGETMKLRVRRNAKEMEVSFILGSSERKTYAVEEVPHPSERQKRIRRGWLHGTTD